MCYVEPLTDDDPAEADAPQIAELCHRLRNSLQQLNTDAPLPTPDASPEELSLWIARFANARSDVVSRYHLLVTRNTLLRLQCCEDIISERLG